MNPIYMVSGSKGGVGKSIVAMALLDYLCQIGKECLLIETDNSNPDVYKAYEQTVQCEILNLDKSDGWMDLVNLCDEPENRGKVIVINGAARSSDGVDKFGEILKGILQELNRELITLWVIKGETQNSDKIAR